MAIREMNLMAIDMMHFHRRDPVLESREERIPVLQNAIADFKSIAHAVKTQASSVGSTCAEFTIAQNALNTLAEPPFQEALTWGMDPASLGEIRDTITRFHEQGHTGLAYVLQIKLLGWGVVMTRQELTTLLPNRQLFSEAMDVLIRQNHLSFPTRFQKYQMFTPRELVRIPTLASQILQDRRLDCLGRASFHILADAGLTIEWIEPSQGLNSIRFSSEHGVSFEWPTEAVDHSDILGRTALHLAVRHCSRLNVIRLAGLGADMHRVCLHGLSLMHIAACHGHFTMVSVLDDCLQYIHVLDQLGDLFRTPFWYAARSAHFEVMETLHSVVNIAYVNIEHENVYGHSPLAIAARNGHVQVLEWLLHNRLELWKMYPLDVPNNEHLLLAYAVGSKNKGCIDLIKRNRSWKYGDAVFQKTMLYAGETRDMDLRNELLGLYQYGDNAVEHSGRPSRLVNHFDKVSERHLKALTSSAFGGSAAGRTTPPDP